MPIAFFIICKSLFYVPLKDAELNQLSVFIQTMLSVFETFAQLFAFGVVLPFEWYQDFNFGLKTNEYNNLVLIPNLH